MLGRSKDRSINWWVNVVGNTSTDQANVATIMQHKQLFSQLQVAWQPGCTSNGDLSPWWWQSQQVETWLSLYKPLNIPIVPAVICIVNATIMHNNLYPNATDFSLTLVDIANTFG